ncbi:MAG: hypothetical protein ACLQDY_22125 [Streptosporangiaceae bacterium]
MRGPDWPGRPDEADAQPAAWPAERLAELRRRLERLPPGHPSAAGYPLQELGGPDPDPGEAGRADHGRAPRDRAGPPDQRPGQDEADRGGPGTAAGRGRAAGPVTEAGPGAEDSPDQPRDAAGDRGPAAGPDREPADGQAADDAADPPGAGEQSSEGHSPSRRGTYPGLPGSGGPYQPWFNDADWDRPWFAADEP